MRGAGALAALLAAACGTGTGSNPAPSTTPAPAPAPAPVTPTVRAVAQITSEPFESGGYSEAETIRVLVDFEQRVSVEGSPRLALEIGEHVRFAEFLPWWEHDWPPERPSVGWRFDYRVGPDDTDADGIAITADAFDLTGGTFLADGVEIEVEIDAVTSAHVDSEHVAVAPGENLAPHRVIGWQGPRVCTNELEHARAFRNTPPVLIREWDGTPFRFYFDAGIPASERADAEHFFGVVERLARRIEDQLGYSILEVEGWIPERDRGFDTPAWALPGCVGVRPGGIVVTVIPEERPSGAAVPECAAFYWANDDIDTTWDGTMAHELFHLFGFAHAPGAHSQQSPPGVGVRMSARLTSQYMSAEDLGVNHADVYALGCVFPHPDVPR